METQKMISLKKTLLQIDGTPNSIKNISNLFLEYPEEVKLKSCNIFNNVYLEIIQTPIYHEKIPFFLYCINEIFKNENENNIFKNFFKNKLENIIKEINENIKFQKGSNSIISNIHKTLDNWIVSKYYDSNFINNLKNNLKFDNDEYLKKINNIVWQDLKNFLDVSDNKLNLINKKKELENQIIEIQKEIEKENGNNHKKLLIDIELNHKSIKELNDRIKIIDKNLIMKNFDIIKKLNEDNLELINLNNNINNLINN